MAKKTLQPKGIHKPLAAYSHVVEGVGKKLVFISGQGPLDVSGNLVGQGDLVKQVRQVLANLEAAAASAGGNSGDICKITIFLTEKVSNLPDGLACMRKCVREFFGSDYPASSLIFVSRLASPDWMVEIEAFAMI